MNKFNICMIGCGRFSRSFVPLFKAHPNVDKVYVCDQRSERANAYSEEFQVPTIASFEDALKDPTINAVAIFTPNEFEEELLLHSSLFTLHSSLAPEVVTTLGAQGCHIHSTGETIPAPPAKAVDSTGAGDTFNAVLAVRLAEEESLHDACVAANAAAARSVEVKYVMPSLPFRN